MSLETDEMNAKIDRLEKKEWAAPKAVERLQVTIDTQDKTIASLKSQLELKDTPALKLRRDQRVEEQAMCSTPAEAWGDRTYGHGLCK